MYGHPIYGLYGHKPNAQPKRKRGRPSNASKWLEKQGDMFLAEHYLARTASPATSRSAAPDYGNTVAAIATTRIAQLDAKQ